MYPVFITAYNRPAHLRECLASLEKNIGAPETEVYIYVDFYRSELDREANYKVVEVGKSFTGFKKLHVIHRQYNMGPHLNSTLAWNELFDKYDAVIRAEDDNIFSIDFLKYVNHGLNKYRDCQDVFTICGYREPIDNCLQGVVKRKFHSAWGFGIWKDRYTTIDFNVASFPEGLTSVSQWGEYKRAIGSHVVLGLLMAFLKKTYYGDFSIIYHMYCNDKVSIFPKKTLVRNIGQDGSGLNSGVDTMLQQQKIYNFDLESDFAEIKFEEFKRFGKYYELPAYKKILTYILMNVLGVIRKMIV